MSKKRIEFDQTDKRKIQVLSKVKGTEIFTDLTQLDILQILTYLKGNNKRLYGQLRRFIEKIDSYSGEETDFERKLPRRASDGKYW